MRNILAIAVVIAGLFGVSMANAAVDQKEVQVGFSDAFIPGGFDTNSDVFVVASGLFPNGCYRWNDSKVNHLDSRTHEISASASVSQGMCIMVLVPFTKEIHLGKLEQGVHAVRLLNGDGTYIEKRLQIEE